MILKKSMKKKYINIMEMELSKVYTGTNLIDFLEGHIEGKEIIYIKICKDEKFRIKEANRIYKYLEELFLLEKLVEV